jgi:hypothetical protein
MGPAGSKVVDPTFGTTILRVTDASDGPDCIAPYTYYPNFNLNSTRLYAQCGNNAVFFSFNPTTMAVSGKRVAPSIGAQAYGMVWSGTNPDVIYMNTNTALVSYNVATNTYTTIRNFSAEIAGNGASHIAQMSVSHDDDMFAWSLGSSGGHTGYLVWKKSTNTFLMNSLDGQADEVHVDKSGRYLTIQKVDGRPTVWDLATKTMTQLGSFDGGTGFYHMDTGTGTLMSGYASGLGYRHLATPNTVTSVLAGFSFGNMHYSMNANNEQWALVWAQRNDTLSNTKPFDNEVLQVATDGSGRVRRIAHHRSKWNDYYDQPNANISPDGQFVAFCSNWGNANGRRDVYVVKIPPASTN